jgi:hypothetical protein
MDWLNQLTTKKMVVENHWNWHNFLSNTLWEDKVTPKGALDTSMYYLVYEQETILPPNVFFPSLQLSHASRAW